MVWLDHRSVTTERFQPTDINLRKWMDDLEAELNHPLYILTGDDGGCIAPVINRFIAMQTSHSKCVILPNVWKLRRITRKCEKRSIFKYMVVKEAC